MLGKENEGVPTDTASGTSADPATEPGSAKLPVNPLSRPMGRVRAWLDMVFVDHGFLRLGYRHWKQVAPGVFRSNQPAPFQVRRAARFGIRTIVNLRGANDSGHYHLEVEACRAAGIDLVDYPIKSRRVPSRQMALDAAALFERVQYPILMHCKSGIDRSGLMGAVYLLSHGASNNGGSNNGGSNNGGSNNGGSNNGGSNNGGSNIKAADVGTALKQFSARYGYLGAGPTGIGKAFIQAYAKAQMETGVAFLDWVKDGYDPDALSHSFKPSPLLAALVNALLRRE